MLQMLSGGPEEVDLGNPIQGGGECLLGFPPLYLVGQKTRLNHGPPRTPRFTLVDPFFSRIKEAKVGFTIQL